MSDSAEQALSIDVITLFPELVDNVAQHGMVRRAISDGKLALTSRQLRRFASNARGDVDDRSYGGGPGMVIGAEPIMLALSEARDARSPERGEAAKVIYLSPNGVPISDGLVRELAEQPDLILLCGRYEGIDQRVIDAEVDLEVSVGDVVVSGGELPAMLLIEALARLLPGVMGSGESGEQDSFAPGSAGGAGMLDHAHYTRPEAPKDGTKDGLKDGKSLGPPPAVLLSGDHDAISRWRQKNSLGRTWLHRPDLLDTIELSDHQRSLLAEYIAELGDTPSSSS